MSEYRKKGALLGNRQTFISGLDAQNITDNVDGGALLRLWREKRCKVQPKGLSGSPIVQLGLADADSNRRWYEAIAGRAPAGFYIAAVSYVTAVILLGQLPWNVLLILLLLLASKNKRLLETRRGRRP